MGHSRPRTCVAIQSLTPAPCLALLVRSHRQSKFEHQLVPQALVDEADEQARAILEAAEMED